MAENPSLPRKAKGERPFFFDNPDVDKLLAMLMGLAGEVSVMRDRLDTALPGENTFPATGNVQSHWRDQAKTRYDNPSFRHLGEPL